MVKDILNGYRPPNIAQAVDDLRSAYAQIATLKDEIANLQFKHDEQKQIAVDLFEECQRLNREIAIKVEAHACVVRLKDAEINRIEIARYSAERETASVKLDRALARKKEMDHE